MVLKMWHYTGYLIIFKMDEKYFGPLVNFVWRFKHYPRLSEFVNAVIKSQYRSNLYRSLQQLNFLFNKYAIGRCIAAMDHCFGNSNFSLSAISRAFLQIKKIDRKRRGWIWSKTQPQISHVGDTGIESCWHSLKKTKVINLISLHVPVSFADHVEPDWEDSNSRMQYYLTT